MGYTQCFAPKTEGTCILPSVLEISVHNSRKVFVIEKNLTKLMAGISVRVNFQRICMIYLLYDILNCYVIISAQIETNQTRRIQNDAPAEMVIRESRIIK